MQHAATRCNTLQHIFMQQHVRSQKTQHAVAYRSVEVNCSVLQHIALCYTLTNSKTLQSFVFAIPMANEIELEMITTAKISNKFSPDSLYISNTFSGLPKFSNRVSRE